MSATLEALTLNLQESLGDRLKSLKSAHGEVTVEVDAADYLDVMLRLRDTASLSFEELIDLCGVDYSAYGNVARQGRRFAVVTHLLSITRNWRLRVRCFAEDDDFPSVPSITPVWNSADWFEREAFDLYGIVFPGHSDLRRILTDYGFVGHPFRKDFPVSGYLEMRYDPDQQRVIYQPVTIEPREITPRIVREATYGNVDHA
ncbi:NADH-quinone oxidoreductase subunit C [Accumulibacter sp.]|uniref:NADH-quinone oxidoreductase subunit C n=1 Tax=Accumulibacter sp. TaxID=2053492 RepID=UPI0025EC88AD|nr:NADH-quinone oxidoreductase subunit C [Accumulibacter sp.]MCM8593897.1 NADH-quinone oxidoreductase subunit C [Accumulibacter sp.]MCM8626061.1 NADH-quinone oxidoreductase subunit C [Accumulibacter sp.]MDS4048038.1 NADH-quinone oxidoreductase subunit C [Accumulibacter sp.]